ncbi:IS1096 element passenger TnpR family protein [Frankia sp. Cr2]|uniref:IS1096 element passenger TnpR family protein n=1 Tax=Frankia sp. Cr2 TaxID=3073932 RepID=UPI002AD4FB03|nr:hypothetical protein [Frankia sp. Cr2]
MTRTHSEWWSIQVELLGGGQAGELWPHPGRTFAVSPGHTFHDFAEAIDNAFARWDRAHLHEFHLPLLGKTVTEHHDADGIDPDQLLNADTATLGQTLQPGNEFGYVFDLGDNWRHWCAIDTQTFDPIEQYSHIPNKPIPVFGWGTIPDPYGRLFRGDNGETPVPTPSADFPWPNAPAATTITLHTPGYYTLTRTFTDEDGEASDRFGS